MNGHATRILLLLSALALGLSACGYRMGESASNFAAAGRSLAIPVFTNASAEPHAEVIFTRAARETFAVRGAFTLVDTSEADAILEGRLLTLEAAPETARLSGAGPRVGTYIIEAELSLVLRDKSGMEQWNTEIRDREAYVQSAAFTHALDNRRDAIERLARRMMALGYSELAEGF